MKYVCSIRFVTLVLFALGPTAAARLYRKREAGRPSLPAQRTELYHREATAHVDGKDLPELGELLVTYQGCRENTVCYSPITKSISPRFSSAMSAGLLSRAWREQNLPFANHEA